jgi:hypothetical protein
MSLRWEKYLSGSTRPYIPADIVHNYMRVEPNSHFWTDLNQLITHLVGIQNSGNQWYENAWKAEVDFLLTGLENTTKRGYEIKKVSGIVNLTTHFTSVENMIKAVNISPDYTANEFLKEFIEEVENTIGMGYNLSNGLKMERKEVYKLIDGERDYQDKTWVASRTANGTSDEETSVAEWITYIEHHLHKAKAGVYYIDTNAALAELRKIAALAVRAMEIHGAPERIMQSEPYSGCCGGDCSCKK